jgi:hypothetical protein
MVTPLLVTDEGRYPQQSILPTPLVRRDKTTPIPLAAILSFSAWLAVDSSMKIPSGVKNSKLAEDL